MNRSIRAALVGAAVSLLPLSAHAAYKIQKTSTGKEVRWFYMPEDFYIDTHGYSGITDGTLLQAEKDSFTPWENVDQCDAKYNLKTSTHGVSDIFNNGAGPTRDRMNEMAFVETDWAGLTGSNSNLIALTFTYFSDSTGKILENDIAANGVDYVWTDTDTNVKTDVRNFLTHEVGHSYGLDHDADDPDSTMFATGTQGETKKRDLAPDDIAGIQHLYPPGCCKHTKTGDLLALIGCDVAGSGATHPWAWIASLAAIGAAVAFRRRARGLAAILVAGGVLAVAVPAHATALVAMPLENLVHESDVIVRGTVVYDAAMTLPTGPIVTVTQIEVAEDFVGGASRVVTIVRYGGTPSDSDVAMRVAGAPELHVGDEVVLFGTAVQGALGREFPDGVAITGFAEGAFHVVRNAGAPARVVRDFSDVLRVRSTSEGFVPAQGDELSGLTLDTLAAQIRSLR